MCLCVSKYYVLFVLFVVCVVFGYVIYVCMFLVLFLRV